MALLKGSLLSPPKVEGSGEGWASMAGLADKEPAHGFPGCQCLELHWWLQQQWGQGGDHPKFWAREGEGAGTGRLLRGTASVRDLRITQQNKKPELLMFELAGEAKRLSFLMASFLIYNFPSFR